MRGALRPSRALFSLLFFPLGICHAAVLCCTVLLSHLPPLDMQETYNTSIDRAVYEAASPKLLQARRWPSLALPDCWRPRSDAVMPSHLAMTNHA